MKKVPAAVIRRLPRYHRYLEDLLKNEIFRISSRELSERMGVTASQIRQDLNCFGGFGQQGYGYHVEHLYQQIGSILGVNNENNLIILGAGKLGQALAKYPNFQKSGFHVCAMFDIDPSIVGHTIAGIRVRHSDELEDFLKTHPVRIAVLTLPKHVTNEMAMRCAAGGIKGILNFSYVDLDLPEDIAIENVHLSDSLMTLSYKITRQEQTD